MEHLNPENKDSFLFPRTRYYGQLKPANMLFNSNLQEFSHKISYIAALETSGKISPEEAYSKVKVLWKQLKRSSKELGFGRKPPQ
jgi:hypothetical protein